MKVSSIFLEIVGMWRVAIEKKLKVIWEIFKRKIVAIVREKNGKTWKATLELQFVIAYCIVWSHMC